MVSLDYWQQGRAPNINFETEREYLEFLDDKQKAMGNLYFFTQGSESFTCRISDEWILKRFDETILKWIDVELLTQFDLLDIPSYYFIQGDLVIAGQTVGGISPYAPGSSFKDTIKRLTFHQLYLACRKHEEDTKLLSDEYVSVEDASPENRLWDSQTNQINTIDTSPYSYVSMNKVDKKILFRENVNWLSENLVECFFDGKAKELIARDKTLQSLIQTANREMVVLIPHTFVMPSELVDIIQERVRKRFGDEVQDIETLNKVLTR